MQRLSEGTRQGYAAGWRQWVLFRQLQDKSPFLEGKTRAEKKRDEDDLMDFTIFLARIMGRQDGTVKQRLFAIRYAHLVEGLPDPLAHRARLWAAINGIKRWQSSTRRKKPITPRMLLWLRSYLGSAAGLGTADAAAIWFAVALGFFFLLRASEYLFQEARSWSWERVLHGEDLAARLRNADQATFRGADEIVIYIKGSKTDQYNVGMVRNHFRSDSAIDIVQAAEEYEHHFPHRLRGAEQHLPICRWADGRPIKREDVQHYLALAAISQGVPAEEVGSHSLRIGGATAMYHVTQDLQQVRRYGRWASDAFHGYLWESHEQVKGLAAKMADDFGELTKPQKPRRREASPAAVQSGGTPPMHGEHLWGVRINSDREAEKPELAEATESTDFGSKTMK